MPVERTITCPVCGDVFAGADMVEVYELYARHETHECDDCGFTGCEDAYRQHRCVIECMECCYEYSPSDYDECPNCADSRGYYEGEAIYNYSYKPIPEFRGEGPFHLGFELEISTDRMNALPIEEYMRESGSPGLLYCKEDSSVCGFEIVSHPMTPEWIAGFDWGAFFGFLNEEYPPGRAGLEERDGHGLHVHISRTAFEGLPKSALARWNYLLQRNRDQVERISRRSSHWAVFGQYPVQECLPMAEPPAALRRAYQEAHNAYIDARYSGGTALEEAERAWIDIRDRYHNWRPTKYRQQWNKAQARSGHSSAVNMSPSETIEVRVGRSTRKPDDFLASVMLVGASADYVRAMHPTWRDPLQPWHATRNATRWSSFVEFCESSDLYSPYAARFAGRENNE